jgi:hypothetical protein
MPVALSEALLGPESPELESAKRMVADRDVKIVRDEHLDGGRRMYAGVAGNTECEGIVDLDGAFRNAKCSCSFFFTNRLRQGPCRHLLALRMTAMPSVLAAPPLAPELVVPPRAGMLTHLPEAVVMAMQQEAERRGVTVHAIAEQAFRIARSKLAETSGLDALLQAAPAATAYRGGQKLPQLLSLPADVEAEIQREAARLDVTVSRVMEAAWILAHDVMKLTSSLLR